MNGRRSRQLRRVMALSLTAKPAAVGLLAISPRVVDAASTIAVACTSGVGDVAALKAAINTANGSPGTTLSLGTGCVYTLTSVDHGIDGLPQVTGSMTIAGNGATITRQAAAPAFRIVDVSSSGDLTINDLTISNGRLASNTTGGAGILSKGKLTLNHATVSGNVSTGASTTAKGGGILSAGDTTINNSLVTGNAARATGTTNNGGSASGGGILAKGGTLKVNNTTISTNSATATGVVGGNSSSATGGGIEVVPGFGPNETPIPTSVTVSGTTFSGNVAASQTSISTTANGGAIDQTNSSQLAVALTTRIVNSTFNGNSAESTTSGNSTGGAISFDGLTGDSLAAVNSTIAGNGSQEGGVEHVGNGTLTLTNTILASNPGGNCTGTVVNGGHNISYPASAAACGSTFAHGNPLLAALGDNGGPTQTMALGTGSAAIDAADPSICQAVQPGGAGGIDQRGLTRSEVAGDTTCDIGAFEVQAAAVIPGLPKAGLPAAPGDPTPGWLAVALAAGAAAAGLGAWRRNPED